MKKGKIVDGKNKKRRKQQTPIDDPSPSPSPYLPQDLVLGNIITRLPVRVLSRFKLVSKLWYNSIVNDTKFAMSHFSHHQTRRKLWFNLHNVLKIGKDEVRNYFFNLEKDGSDEYNFKLLHKHESQGRSIEPVGNCNGLSCFQRMGISPGSEEIIIVNPFRRETLNLICLIPKIGGGGGSLKYLCHGFGFDLLSQEYKVVLIYTTSTSEGDRGFICMVLTLGVRSWRKVVTSTCDMLPPPGYSPFPSQMVTTMWKKDHRSAAICGGDLLWRITHTGSLDGNKIEMLLSFDIHNEKIQFIGLPEECNSLQSTLKRDYYLEIGHHLLEFKGYPCVARSAKRLINRTDSNKFCHYRFEILFYILKDKVNQEWENQESFDVRLKDDSFEPGEDYRNPFLQYFSHIDACPTRIFSFSDQMILYWFDGGCLIFYHLEHHNVVEGFHSDDKQTRSIFKDKMKEINPDPDYDEEDVDDSECVCPLIDYQLHAQVENIISLNKLHS
ncbi:F-box protein At1g30790-like [Papaver somniferum]|uniref:F-box protein At1g30790-like n=1 Tax=Papaver somniferum TaxID=3469 RepID=UPI000E6FACF4|nr:F-box protein At1g30790-like [Papaver somniferum]XP_026408549.1 F-box protein At1g30790-like [Papaver somniferum]XP_026408550.1 F-box protein At1g30790-like [Papaver somniferum]XP_026408551.1 F-box protein At1g30790-like [Papaver somniferum]XP_026408552.1 F-box protein At1g30790-like [Papaver somniferum]XP_026408553.1 F-box protein At1g30790-like [Papaver somniferum]